MSLLNGFLTRFSLSRKLIPFHEPHLPAALRIRSPLGSWLPLWFYDHSIPSGFFEMVCFLPDSFVRDSCNPGNLEVSNFSINPARQKATAAIPWARTANSGGV